MGRPGVIPGPLLSGIITVEARRPGPVLFPSVPTATTVQLTSSAYDDFMTVWMQRFILIYRSYLSGPMTLVLLASFYV